MARTEGRIIKILYQDRKPDSTNLAKIHRRLNQQRQEAKERKADESDCKEVVHENYRSQDAV